MKFTIFRYFLELKSTLLLHLEAIEFIRQHKIWKGSFDYKWFSKISFIIAIFISLKLLNILWNALSGASSADAGLIKSAGVFLGDLVTLTKNLFFSGGFKYIVLIFLEILIFHSAVKATNILRGTNYQPSFNDFIDAEIRMIKVVFRSWILESLSILAITIGLGLFGLGFLAVVFGFFIQCYFLGYAFLDNFLEQFGESIRSSARISSKYKGACVAVGLVSYTLLLVPIIGLFVAPILGAVTATLFLNNRYTPQPIAEYE